MTDMESRPQAVIDHHTLHGEFKLSNGGTSDTYIDLRAALLCPLCGESVAHWYSGQIEELAEGGITAVATGSFGALLLGSLTRDWRCVLWNPKGHGVEWSGTYVHRGFRVVLLDDVVTTGGTLRALRAACEKEGWEVVGEIVAVRRA